jgi:hypothetical protein
MTEWWRTARATARALGRVPLVLRLVVLASCALAIGATIVPAWDVPDAYVAVAVLATGVATVVPDAGGGFFFAAAIVAAWASGPDGPAVGPAVVVTALALLFGHLAAALAASMPPTADADRRLLWSWGRPTAVLAAAVAATAMLVALLDAWTPPGSIVVVLAALVVVALGAGWWSATEDPPSGSG